MASSIFMDSYLLVTTAVVLASLLKVSIAQTDCTNGDVRLVEGFSPTEGRVEACQNSEWTIACDSQWDDTEAEVVCRQLGFPAEGAEASRGTEFGVGSANVYFTDVECTGDEARLADCTNVMGTTCNRDNIAGAICTANADIAIYYNGELLQNNSIINAVDIENDLNSDYVGALVCVTNQFPCCSRSTGENWYDPEVSLLPENLASSRYYQKHFSRRSVVLYRSLSTPRSAEGLFHCHIADAAQYIGIYSTGAGVPMVSSVTYDRSSQTVICTSTGGPVTSVTWSRDRTPLTVDGTTYQQSQIITDTNTATYENRLTIVQPDRPETYGLYMCTVSNLRGNNSVELNVTVCNDGEANITAAGIINALCYQGVWHDVIQRTSSTEAAPMGSPSEPLVMTDHTTRATAIGGNMEQSGTGGQDSGVLVTVFGSLFVLALLGLVAVVAGFMLFEVGRRKMRGNHYDIPLRVDLNNRYDEVGGAGEEHMVRNSIYGVPVDTSMSENVAYSSVHQDAGNTYEEVDLPVGHEGSMADTQQRNGATSPVVEAENLYEVQSISKADVATI